jgi:hypothetical protein
MSCELTLGRNLGCKDLQGGVTTVYFINGSVALSYTTASNGSISNLGGTCYKYELPSETSGLAEAITSDPIAGTTFFEQVLDINLHKITASDNAELYKIIVSRPKVIVQDKNGNFRLAGLLNGMEVTGGSITTGVASGDQYGYQMTLTGKEKLPARFITDFTGLSTEAFEVVSAV